MLDTQLAHTIAYDPSLRTRVEACVRRRLATHTVTHTEALLLASPPLDALAWAVAANPTIFTAVKTAVAAAGTVAAAIEAGLSDSDLEFVVYGELTCLQT